MKPARFILTFGLLALLSASCAPDPRREADAAATRLEAQSQAAAEEQARRIKEDKHNAWMEQWNAAKPFVTAMLQASLIALMFASVTVITSFGIGMSTITISAGFATARRQFAKPIEIKLDPVTRQYPLLMNKVCDGKFSLTNPNTGSVTMLYERNPADKQMIQAMSAVQYIGAMGHEARLSHKPDALTGVEVLPQIVDMENY